MYRIHDYGDMMAYEPRMAAYAAAIRARVQPGAVVLDLGAGPGIMTLLACRAGARRVYAVEPGNVIQVGREAAAANGYADRVTFIQTLSTATDLPEKVDVIIADLRGALPLHQGSLPAIIDARDRFLKPDGHVIPASDHVVGAVASAPELYAQITHPWEGTNGFDWKAGRSTAVNSDKRWQAPPDALLTAPARCFTVDYERASSYNARGRVQWRVERDAIGHGLTVWFDSETAAGHTFSNAPSAGKSSLYGQVLFPWTQPVGLRPGDWVEADVRADVVGDDYIWSWRTDIRADGPEGAVKARFDQTHFQGVPLSSEWVRKTAAAFQPTPGRSASIDRLILEGIFAGKTLQAIAEDLSARFPDRFSTWQKALGRVGSLSLQYSD